MKKIVTLALILSLLLLSACTWSNYPSTTGNETTAGKDIVYKDYPGNTGIKLGQTKTTLPANIFTTTGSENGLAGTLYAIEGKVIECNTSGIYPYFIVSTDGGDVWISDVSEETVTGSSNVNGLTIDLDILKSFYPFPEIGEDIRVVAQYQGMSGTTNYPTFVYGGSDYLTTALMRSASISTNPDYNDSTQATPPTIDPTQTPPPEKGSKENPYKAGMYKVGTELPAGEYLFYPSGSQNAYVCVSSDSNQDNIIENENFSNSFFVTVSDGQYLQAKRCYFVKASDYTVAINEDGSFGEGMYRVGIDIPVGEYKLTSGENRAYWCLYSSGNIPFDIDDNDNFEGSAYVTVRKGQYLIIKRCTAKPV